MIRSTRCDGIRVAAPVIALLFNASPALAQKPAPEPLDRVAAEALFQEARALLEKGDYAAGCPKFEQSLALNPSASTMLNIARCQEHDGRIAAAWESYHRALSLNHETTGAERQKVLEDIATKGGRALEPRLPRLRIVISRSPEGLIVQRDGKPLLATVLGEALPADPGPHEIRASAPGYRPETRSVILEEGKTTVVELSLEAEPRVGGHAAKGGKGGVPAWAWVSGGAGLALGGAAVFFLADDLSAIKALRNNCQSDQGRTYCSPGYDVDHDNARKNRGFGLFVGLGSASVIALGAAVVGIVTAPRARKPDDSAGLSAVPVIGRDRAGAAVSGRF